VNFAEHTHRRWQPRRPWVDAGSGVPRRDRECRRRRLRPPRPLAARDAFGDDDIARRAPPRRRGRAWRFAPARDSICAGGARRAPREPPASAKDVLNEARAAGCRR
jgi:hypothetical protein